MNDKIAYLNLRKNNLGDMGIKAIMKTVGKSRSLMHLDVSSNNIGHKGAKRVFKALAENQSLISLAIGSVDNVQKNKIGNESALKHLVHLLINSRFL